MKGLRGLQAKRSIIPSEMRNASVIPNRRNVLDPPPPPRFGWTRCRPDPRTGYLASKLFLKGRQTHFPPHHHHPRPP